MAPDIPLLHADLEPLPGPAAQWPAPVFAELSDTDRDMLRPATPFLESVFETAPYLARLALNCADELASWTSQSGEQAMKDVLERVAEAGQSSESIEALDRSLRQAKARMHLIVAFADLSGQWPVEHVTGAVTRFADASVQACLLAHVRFGADRGQLDPPAKLENPLPGVVFLALGKMGTGELNYSSDIDLVAVYDPDVLHLPDGQEPRKRLPRLVQAVVKSLQDVTADGYVFRVDLRLRPDPGASPVIMSTEAALNYYEALGQTWERAAWIKARCCAGDQESGARYIGFMQPFIWRRALDYAAVDDVRGLARQIQTVGDRAVIRLPGHDLKLGRGGIREIEFYAQVPQLVFGGRDASVRRPGTLPALAALVERDVIDSETVASLSDDYRRLRQWEHRIQMRQDEASQTLPQRDEDRHAIARMAGFTELHDFDTEVETVLRRVHGHFSDQFQDDRSLSSECGTLILTGVEPTPDTLETLSRLGFEAPEQIWKRLNGWAAGRARAVRNARARSLFMQIAPRLVDIMASTGEPDAAMTRFAAFFESLPIGVQPLSLLTNEPALAADLIAILTMAPRMASELARRPDLLDVMLDKRFSVPLAKDTPDDFRARLEGECGQGDTYEAALNTARRLVREERFRVGTQILRGTADAQTAGAAFAAIADAAVESMAQAAEIETCRRQGEMPGRYVVLGMGKLGGRELSADSDIDLMIVYDGESDAAHWFTRFAQRLISALSVPTEEGGLYEVDMQLRPSGKAGPVAVQFSRFEAYYESEAWTWEMMALTRARVVAGDPELGDRVMAAAEAALARPRDRKTVLSDARDMRRRLEEAKPPRNDWDLKARPGGLQDIEFIAQALQVCAAPRADVVRNTTVSAISALVNAAAIEQEDAVHLIDSVHMILGMAQLLRSAHGSGFDPSGASANFAKSLSGLGGASDLDALQDLVSSRLEVVRGLYVKYLEV